MSEDNDCRCKSVEISTNQRCTNFVTQYVAKDGTKKVSPFCKNHIEIGMRLHTLYKTTCEKFDKTKNTIPITFKKISSIETFIELKHELHSIANQYQYLLSCWNSLNDFYIVNKCIAPCCIDEPHMTRITKLCDILTIYVERKNNVRNALNMLIPLKSQLPPPPKVSTIIVETKYNSLNDNDDDDDNGKEELTNNTENNETIELELSSSQSINLFDISNVRETLEQITNEYNRLASKEELTRKIINKFISIHDMQIYNKLCNKLHIPILVPFTKYFFNHINSLSVDKLNSIYAQLHTLNSQKVLNHNRISCFINILSFIQEQNVETNIMVEVLKSMNLFIPKLKCGVIIDKWFPQYIQFLGVAKINSIYKKLQLFVKQLHDTCTPSDTELNIEFNYDELLDIAKIFESSSIKKSVYYKRILECFKNKQYYSLITMWLYIMTESTKLHDNCEDNLNQLKLGIIQTYPYLKINIQHMLSHVYIYIITSKMLYDKTIIPDIGEICKCCLKEKGITMCDILFSSFDTPETRIKNFSNILDWTIMYLSFIFVNSYRLNYLTCLTQLKQYGCAFDLNIFNPKKSNKNVIDLFRGNFKYDKNLDDRVILPICILLKHNFDDNMYTSIIVDLAEFLTANIDKQNSSIKHGIKYTIEIDGKQKSTTMDIDALFNSLTLRDTPFGRFSCSSS